MAASLLNVKLMLEIDSTDNSYDNLLNLYISRATKYVLRYCNALETTLELDEIIEDVTVFRYRSKGVENLKSEGKGSLSETYIESLPKDIVDRMNENRRIRFV
jgi:hypothetical protein